jgi:hypothetical protein
MISLGEVIATRTVAFRGDDGATADVMIEIGRPVQDQDSSGDYCCPYRITGLGPATLRAMTGFDSAQALVLALQAIPAELDHLARRHIGRFTWLGDSALGFPELETASK